jgi:glutathione S-transferase
MPRLITIPFSHFCEKARWALEYARVAFREEGHVPGAHRFAVTRACGRPGSVPVLILDGEGALDDSPLIVRWADAHAPVDRKLLPPHGTRQYEEALALERHFDVELAPHTRRFAYFHILPDRALTLALMKIETPRAEHAAVSAVFPVLRTLMRRAMRIDQAGAARSRDKVRRVFDEVAQRLSDGRPYLLGDRFGAADIAFAAFSSPLFTPAEHPLRKHAVEPPQAFVDDVRDLRETPAGAFALKLYRERRNCAALPPN